MKIRVPPGAIGARPDATVAHIAASALVVLLTAALPASAQPGSKGPPEWAGGPPSWAGGPPPWAVSDDDDDDEEEVVVDDEDAGDGEEEEEEQDDGDAEEERGNNGLRHAVTALQRRVASLEALIGALDLDGDGFTGAGGDCNDADEAINPDAVEIMDDGIDNNCDGSIDGAPPPMVDGDDDGYYASGADPALVDCDDEEPSVNPGAEEIPGNAIDENCDGVAEE